MRAVHIGIGHDDNLVVTQLLDIEILMNTGTERGDHSADLIVFQNTVESRFFNVQDLTAKRKDCLRRADTRGFCGTACGISLYDEDFKFCGIPFGTVGKLAGKALALKRGLPAGKVSCLTGGVTGALGKNGLLDNDLRNGRMLLEIVSQLLAHNAVHGASRLAVSELLLRLSFELRLRKLNADNRGKTFADIFAVQCRLVILDHLVRSRVSVDRLGQRVTETDQMHTAFGRRNIVYETVAVIVICVVMLHGNFDGDFADRAFAVNNVIIQSGIALVQVLHVFLDAAFVMEHFGHRILVAEVGQSDLQTFRQECHFTETLLQGSRVKCDVVENCRVRIERYRRTGILRVADNLQGGNRLAALIALLVLVSVPADDYFEPLGKRVNNRSAYAVQTAGYLVSSAAEFAAGMQDGKYDLNGGNSFLLVDFYRNTAPVVLNRYGAVRVNAYVDFRTNTCQRFIHRVINNFVNKVVKSALRRASDVHTGTPANRFQSFKDLNLFRAVLLILILTHTNPPKLISIPRKRKGNYTE